MVTPAAKREAAGGLRKAHPASERRICRLLGLHRSTARSRPEPGRDDGPLADRLRELARRHPRYGYLTPPRMLKREGLVTDRKRKRRACSRLGLQVRAKRRRRLWRPRVPMAAPTRPNERWPAGFMSDQLASGRRFRILNVVAGFSRPRVGQLVATSITGARLALFLAGLGKAPKAVVCDNGPELTSKAMRFWSERSGAALNFVQPGKPTQNAFVEGFNGKFRDSCLTRHWFRGLADVRRIVDDWHHHSTMSGRTAPWATRRPPNARSKPCLFTLLATGLVLGGGSSRPRVGQLVATSITGAKLALFLDELGKAPKAVVCDNGP